MFGQLVNYSSYSFQESTMSIHRFVKRANDLKIKAIALTDKDNMYGAIEFKKACERYDIKAIYGLEASVIIEDEIYPFVLLAKNKDGYFSLVKITSDIQLSKEKAIALEALREYKESLYFLCGGEESILERLVLKGLENESIKYMKQFKEYFGGAFYICIQNHDLALQQNINKKLIGLAEVLAINVVCSNQNAYILPSEAITVDYLKASKEQTMLPLTHFPKTNQRYLKSDREMFELFDELIIHQTSKLVDGCNSDIPLNQLSLAKYPTKNNIDSNQYLKELCKVGLKKRFNNQQVPIGYIKRLDYELSVILSMNYADYFLIVWDYVRYAKSKGILVGPGRGSAAGSLVSYVLGIVNADPIKYNLFFERFLNPERVSMPDIDIDFEDSRRDEIVEYLTEKYGKKHVAQIVTFNTYGPKVAIKDLGKVAGVPLGKLEVLTKLIPTSYKYKKSAKEVFNTSVQFQNLVNRDGAIGKFIPSVFVVESLPKNISTHAAGVVLSDKELDQVVPLTVGPTGTLMTQYSKDYIEEAGLLKMDILGLRNLGIISAVLRHIKKSKQIEIDINSIDMEDSKTYQMIAKGETFGVFQLESSGMINLLRNMKVSNFEDIIVAISLYRPGPMINIPSFLNRKFNKEKIDYIDPNLKEILKPTYGIIVYQEQIMQIASTMAGFSLGKADILRKAISKKETELMESMKEEFVRGAINNGYSKDKAIEVFSLIERFANYGFNRAHSVSYAYVAYQIAYLKSNYSLEFFSALLSNDYNSETHRLACIQEASKYGIKMLPPSINYSHKDFVVENNSIRYSLVAIKNVGSQAYQSIIYEREKSGLFEDIFDFFVRMYDTRLSNKVIESLVYAGVFDEFNHNRKTILENLKSIESYASLHVRTGFNELPILTSVAQSKAEILDKEKEVLGIYLTTHPITLYKNKISIKLVSINQYMQYVNKKVVSVICIQRVKVIKDKKGNYMAFITVYDETGSVDGVVFSNYFEQFKDDLSRGSILLVEGKIDYKNALSLVLTNVKQLNRGD